MRDPEDADLPEPDPDYIDVPASDADPPRVDQHPFDLRPEPRPDRPRLVPVPRDGELAATEPNWVEVRRLYVQGIACGPSYPNRDDILDRIGDRDPFVYKYGGNRVTSVGKTKVLFPTLRGVAKAFGLGMGRVERRAHDEDWVGLQRIYRAQLSQRHGQWRSQRRLVNVDKIDARAYAVSKLGLKMIEERLQSLGDIVEVTEEGVGPVGGAAASARELESLARAAGVMHTLGRRALGFPVDKVGVLADPAAAGELGVGVYDGEVVDIAMDGETDNGNYAVALGVPEGMADTKTSVSEELSKDDAERLHGFLTMLGRAQDASVGDGDAEAEKAEAG
jgi:hypothetical protein